MSDKPLSRFWYFWYSAGQRRWFDKIGSNRRNFARLEDGREVEYTECCSFPDSTPICLRFKDGVYLGRGKWSRSEGENSWLWDITWIDPNEDRFRPRRPFPLLQK